MANSPPPENQGSLLDSIRGFGRELEDLLNSTVCRDIHLSARWVRDAHEGRLGFGLDMGGIPRSFPLPGPTGDPSCYLYLFFRLVLNPEGYLVVVYSALRVYLDANESGPLFRYEYLRDSTEPYPDPHLHIESDLSNNWRALNERTGQTKGLSHLHFPVGGKRYRPSLEDFLEFLISEGYVRGHLGWEDAITIQRETFHKRQLSAAVKADPTTAIDALEESGYRLRRR